jgi:hypothetical protein
MGDSANEAFVCWNCLGNYGVNSEKWRLIDAGGGKTYIQNVGQGKYLTATPAGVVLLTTNPSPSDWETYTIVPRPLAGATAIVIKTFHNTYLTVPNVNTGVVTTTADSGTALIFKYTAA